MIQILEQIRFVCYVLLLLPLPLTLWTVIVGIFGIKKSKAIPHSDKKARFAILICAKDEQTVIGKLINSLKAQNYDKNKYTIFVVADNCTDNTAKVAQQHGAIVFERFNTILKGKGYAMQWAIKKINSEYSDCFDAFTVFDADNLVTPDFLSRTNDALQNGADITQGYRDTKNPFDSTVSGCYAIYWLLLMRFFHCARGNLGLSCMVGGTGYAFKTELVKDGFYSQTMTEDIEFSLNQILLGKKIVPVRDAIFYDEQPTDYHTSITQRFRWTVGNLQCAAYILPNLIRNKNSEEVKNISNKLSKIDAIVYMISAYAVPFVTVIALAYSVLSFVIAPENWIYTLKDSATAFIITSLIIMLLAFLTVVFERKPLLKYLHSILFFPLFIIPLSIMAVVAVFPREIEWKQIKHSCAKDLSEITDYANIS